jgi:hypothetical protein
VNTSPSKRSSVSFGRPTIRLMKFSEAPTGAVGLLKTATSHRLGGAKA